MGVRGRAQILPRAQLAGDPDVPQDRYVDRRPRRNKRGQRTSRTEEKRLDAFVKKWFAEPDGGNPSRATWEFADAAQFEEMLEDHLRALAARRVDGGTSRDGERTDSNPYRGLRSFELGDAAFFFGRSRARNELREVLARRVEQGQAFVLVFGASGSGKSSLAKAGLLADLLPRRGSLSRAAGRGAQRIDGIAAGSGNGDRRHRDITPGTTCAIP